MGGLLLAFLGGSSSLFNNFKLLIEESSHDSVFNSFVAEGSTVGSGDGSGSLGQLFEGLITGTGDTVEGYLSITTNSKAVSLVGVLDGQSSSFITVK